MAFKFALVFVGGVFVAQSLIKATSHYVVKVASDIFHRVTLERVSDSTFNQLATIATALKMISPYDVPAALATN